MAIVLALVIVGWLVAFALGSQVGFDNQPVATQQPSKSAASQSPSAESAAYREPVSAA